ncbi:hypothetical protein QZH41_005407 [Actinostola sp. cb2023]|nr:hypothetical protein QZH41_005407 [Actinostola sp. cb2023]
MKIELGLQTRECQRDWYDDTKQDTFFTQSALFLQYGFSMREDLNNRKNLTKHLDVKNTQCQKLVIDRGRAPKNVGTFTNISLYGYFQFSSNSQEVSAQSAGIGSKVVKSATQMRALSGRSTPLAASSRTILSTGRTSTDVLVFTFAERTNPSLLLL